MKVTPKTYFAILTLALAVLLGAPANAADFSLMGSYMDTEDLGEAGGVGVRMTWNFGRTYVDLSAHYIEQLDEVLLDKINDIDQFDDLFLEGIEIIPIDLGLRFSPGGFYYGAGVSYYIIDGGGALGDVEDEVGWYGIAGLEFGQQTRFFVEAQYREIEGTAGDDPLDVIDGFELDLGGLGFNVGVTFEF